MAAGECLNWRGGRGSNPRPPGRRSNQLNYRSTRKNGETLQRVSRKPLNPRRLSSKTGDLATHLATQRSGAYYDLVPAWNTARIRGTSCYWWSVSGGSQRSTTLRNEFPDIAVAEHVHQVHNLAL